MRTSLSLPAATPEAAAHSARLRDKIRHEIRAQGGWIDFARYMEMALYDPEYGYYMAGVRKFGTQGDFVTAPEMTPLFGRTLARQVAQILRLTQPCVLELGAGSGALAVDLLLELKRLGIAVTRYAILELSAELRERQRARMAQRAPECLECVQWLDQLPTSFSGAIVANEVFDALPVHRVAWRDSGIFVCGVALDTDDRFLWTERPAQGELLEAAKRMHHKVAFTLPYVSEISLAGPALIRSLGHILNTGSIVSLDYGYLAEQYYAQNRTNGTLQCHYQQRAHNDVFFYPGLQDITAHVDFSALAAAAQEVNLLPLGYATQAQFLLRCGITDLLAETDPADAAQYLPKVAQVQRLRRPNEMGEVFKVLALGRGIDEPLVGFNAS